MSEHTAADRDKVHQALLKLEGELLAFLQDETGAADTVELDQGAQGRVSRVDAIQAQKMAQAQKRRAEQRLERVRNVLQTAEEETFGCCFECGEAIRLARLLARPDSVLCVECATAREG